MEDVRTCRICGPESLFKAWKAYVSTSGKQIYAWRCVKCEKRKRKRHYQKNRETSVRRKEAWRQANLDSCRAVRKAWSRKPENKEKRKVYDKTRREDRRIRILIHYSSDPPLCALCEESADRFLVLDHPEGGGTEQRRKVGSGDKYYKWIAKNNFPEDLRVLCHNCNCALSAYGKAPVPNYGSFERPDFSSLSRRNARIQKRRLACLLYYSSGDPRCACCGISNYEYLTFDHINGDGNQHRKQGLFGYKMYSWMIDQCFPDGFQVLCFNCNFAKSLGPCPHRESPSPPIVPISENSDG